jgi:uncharacterized protein YecT (DUF1311 family)
MARIAIFSAACAFAMAVCATLAAAEESPEEMLARDAAVVQACLDVAEARRVAADAAETANVASPGAPDEAKKAGPEGHLEAAALLAGYAAESCIGVVSDPCMETEEASSTYGMMNCYGREAEVWDARLNASYRERMAPQTGPTNAVTDAMEARQLRKIQAAWIPFRDATCEVLYSDGIPIYGSLGRVDGVYCTMVLTARQALWMEGLLKLGFE